MVLNFFIFLAYSLTLLLSTIGYGLIFNKIIFKKNDLLNLSLLGIFGLFLLYLVSFFTHLFVAHNFLHNILIHMLGLFFFSKFRSQINKKELKLILLFFFVLFIGFLISKTNEDFPFYHLPLSLHLAEQKLQFGLGNLNFAYNHWSSLFLINSLFYLPITEIYLFNLPNFLIQIFFFSCLVFFLKNNKIPNFSLVLISVTLLIFIAKFNRLAEYGVDYAGQFLVILSIIICSFSIFDKKKIDQNQLLLFFEISFILIIFATTTKILYSIYILIPLSLALYQFRFKDFILYFLNYRFISILFLGLLSFIFYNFVTSGCLIYPISKTCFYNEISWTMKKETIDHLRIHYNAWSKGGIIAGNILPEGVSNIKDYISSLHWIKNWIHIYFFNKVSDFILLIFFVKLVFFAVFRNDLIYSNNILKKDIKIFLFFYFFILIVFFIWFFNFPTLRYAGYSIVFLSLVLPFCFLISYKIDISKSVKKKYIYLIIISIIIFNLRNIDRINNEASLKLNENHNFSNFPFYWIKDVKYKRQNDENDIFFSIESGNFCWATPSVCFSGNNINIQNKKNYLIFSVK